MLKALARAKVNPFLRVLPPRKNGFHDIVSLFLSIDLADELHLSPGKTGDKRLLVEYSSSFLTEQGMALDDSNLVLKAESLFYEEIKEEAPPLQWQLLKRIPLASGLGGGSADAAAALLLLNEKNSNRLSEEELHSVAAKVGADVPFCLSGGTALVTGIGDKIEHLSPLPKMGVVLLRPLEGMPTPEAYGALDKRYGWEKGVGDKKVKGATEGATARLTALLERLSTLNMKAAGPLVDNDFQDLLKGELPVIDDLLKLLEQAGALVKFLTGSGSCVAAILEDEQRAKEILTKVNSHPSVAWSATCSIASLGAELVETKDE